MEQAYPRRPTFPRASYGAQDTHTADGDGRTDVDIWPPSEGYIDAVRLLETEIGAVANAKDDDRRTLQLLTASRIVTERGADIYAKDDDGGRTLPH